MPGLLRPVMGVHKKEVALLTIFGENEEPEQIEVSGRLFIVKLVTFTVNVRLIEQVPRVPFNVYKVVLTGESKGLRMVGLLTPSIGVHENTVALLTMLGVNEAPPQIVVSARLLIAILFVIAIVTGKVLTQELASVIVAV